MHQSVGGHAGRRGGKLTEVGVLVGPRQAQGPAHGGPSGGVDSCGVDRFVIRFDGRVTHYGKHGGQSYGEAGKLHYYKIEVEIEINTQS